MKPVTKPQAVQIIQTVADVMGIKNPSELYDDVLIDLHIKNANTPCRYRKTHNPTANFICLVEQEFGGDIGDPHDNREYEIYLRG